jgi:tetratricopeptide (TPR) repeat protein
MAAFLDGRLSAQEREPIAGHLADCERCYFIFTEAAQTLPAALPRSTADLQWWKRRRVLWSGATLLAAAAAVILAVRTDVFRARTEPAALQQLVRVVGTERPLQPRLSGGFAYGPRRSFRAGEAAPMSLSPDVRITTAQIEKDTAGAVDPSALRMRGIACAVGGNLDCAVAALEAAASARPTDARMLNDFAAVSLARGERTRNQDDGERALAAVSRALEIDGGFPEARFNRAYALEQLGMASEARDAWQAYLTIDNQSGWADEARAHLRSLSQP